MSRDPAFRQWVAAARGTPIAEALAMRAPGHRLRGHVERVGGCPKCGSRGAVSNRFSINVVRNVFRCRQCDGRGDPIAFVMWLEGVDFLGACEILTGMAPPGAGGSAVDLAALAGREEERRLRREAEAAESDRYRQREREELYGWWMGARRVGDSPVMAYLARRRLRLPPDCRSIRYAPAARYHAEEKDADGRFPVLHRGPCMWAAMVGPEGRFTGLHMTWINPAAPKGKVLVLDPRTGELVSAKKTRGSLRGVRIELSSPADPTGLVMGEGIETVLARYSDLVEAGEDVSRTAFWSTVNLYNLGGPHEGNTAHPTKRDLGNRPVRVPGPVPRAGLAIPVPDSVERITLLGDGDSDGPLTVNTLARAAARYARPGREILTDMAPPGLDWDDVRRRRLALA